MLSRFPVCLSLLLSLAAFACGRNVGAVEQPEALSVRKPTPLNASVMIFNEWGLKDAVKAVEQVAKSGHGRVNFVVTIHCRLDKDLRPQSYGLIRAQEGWQDTSFDEALLIQFRDHLKMAFAKAAQLNLEIAILPQKHVPCTLQIGFA